MDPTTSSTGRLRVVIVGAGFGGLSAARRLSGTGADVTIVDQQNHHVFQPLLYQVATAGLSPADIAAPIRSIVRRQSATQVILDQVTGLDTQARRVRLAAGDPLEYDQLILATGVRHSYFGHEEWAVDAPGLKTLDDATRIRRLILIALEHAERSPPGPVRDRWLTFALIGGGPTGVEMAGAVSELTRHAVMADFRHIMKLKTRTILIEAGPRVLATFPEQLSECALRSLRRLGVEVRLNTRVTGVDRTGIDTTEGRLDAGTVLWTAGVRASPVADWMNFKAADAAGRIPVESDLTAPGHPEIFVIGDAAISRSADGVPVPGVAPAAKQMGRYAATVIAARIGDRPPPGPFHYRNLGNLATIGRKRAVVDFGWLRISGVTAWLLWCIAHIFFLVGFRNRLMVGANWLWHYITFDRGARLISGLDLSPPPIAAPPLIEVL